MPRRYPEYGNKYVKENIRQFMFKLNKQYDQEMIDFLDSQASKNDYIKQLIKADMEKQKAST